MATLFGIIVSLDALERAYVRESVSEAQYAPACTRLLAQYKTISKLVITSDGQDGGASVMSGIPVIKDVQDFMTTFKVCATLCISPSTLANSLALADGTRCGCLSHSSGRASDSRACLCIVVAVVVRTSQVGCRDDAGIHHLYGCPQAQAAGQGPASSAAQRPHELLLSLLQQQRQRPRCHQSRPGKGPPLVSALGGPRRLCWTDVFPFLFTGSSHSTR